MQNRVKMTVFPDNLTIRRARENDLPEMARIHTASYPGIPMTLEERINHFRNNVRLPLEGNWVCVRNAVLVGIFALYDFRLYRSDSYLPAGGIGRVAVSPEARLEKIAYWMMARAVEIMEQNGIPVSILYPFRHSFYRNMGWGLAEKITRYRMSPRLIPVFEERSGMEPVVTNEAKEEVMACYHRYALKNYGLLVRDDPVWYEHTFKNCLIYAYRSPDSGEIEGYLLYQYRPHQVDHAFMVSDILVKEMVWNSDRAVKGILGFLSSQRDQVKMVEFHDHSDLPLEHILKDPLMVEGNHNMLLGAETSHAGSALMGRIIQLPRIFTSGSFGSGEGKVTFKIKDEINEKNAAPLAVEFNDGKAEILKRKTTDFSVFTDIATLSSIYWGTLTLQEAAYFGLVEIEGKGDHSFLDSVLSFPRLKCLDHF